MPAREQHFTAFNFSNPDRLPPEIAQRVALTCLNELFPYLEEPEFLGSNNGQMSDLAAKVHEGMDGNSNMRMRRAIHPQAREPNLGKIISAIQKNEPIPVVVLYGTAKLPYSLNSGDNEADLADFAAIQMLSALDKRVGQFYKPGLTSRLYFEDGVGFWLFGNDAVVDASQQNYFRSLFEMDRAFEEEFGRNTVEIVKESDLLEAGGYTMSYFLERCASLEPLFRTYLEESESVMEAFIAGTEYQTWENAELTLKDQYQQYWNQFAETNLKSLESYNLLKKEGWIGFIPPEMRSFYINRFRTNANKIEDNHESLLSYTAHYFASTLSKAQLRTPFLSLPGDKSDFSNALKLTLIKLAPGIPDPYQTVFQMRAFPKKSADTCAAPWRSRGGVLFCSSDNRARPSIVPALRSHEGEIYPSHVQLSTGGLIRADLAIRNA